MTVCVCPVRGIFNDILGYLSLKIVFPAYPTLGYSRNAIFNRLF